MDIHLDQKINDEFFAALESGGYRHVNLVKFPGDFTGREIQGGGWEIDVFLKQNKTAAVRITYNTQYVVTSIVSFDVDSGQINLPLLVTSIGDVVEKPSKGNVIYYYGTTVQKQSFAVLRGGGLTVEQVKAYIKSVGFRYREYKGSRRIMAWYADISLSELIPLLARIRDLGYVVKPSDKLNVKRHLKLPASQPINPFTAAMPIISTKAKKEKKREVVPWWKRSY